MSDEAMRASAVTAGVPDWMVRNVLAQPHVDYTYIHHGNTYVYDRAQNLFVLRDAPIIRRQTDAELVVSANARMGGGARAMLSMLAMADGDATCTVGGRTYTYNYEANTLMEQQKTTVRIESS